MSVEQGMDPRLPSDGVVIRPLEVGDLAALRAMFFRLSPQTVYRRFFRPIREPKPSVLEYLVSVDHDRREALVAEVDGRIVGVARYDRVPERDDEAEVAIVVEDAWQGRGLGQRLMRRLVDVAAERGVATFRAEVLGGNREAVHLVRRLCPDADLRYSEGAVCVLAPLPAPSAASSSN